MAFRIYVDEAGTHSDEWMIIGMLFVPDHGPLHSALCEVKHRLGYFNKTNRNAVYRETHLAKFRSANDAAVSKEWIDVFLQHNCFYRCVVIDWAMWDGRYFGNAFDPEALKRRRAYKKWTEMLLRPELKGPNGEAAFFHAKFYLDRLRILYGYDVLDHLKECFTPVNYRGESPYIEDFQHTDSWRDANQCLQLCDLLTGCIYQSLVPSKNEHKHAARAHLEMRLKPLGITRLDGKFWKGFAKSSIRAKFPKFCAWFWKPE